MSPKNKGSLKNRRLRSYQNDLLTCIVNGITLGPTGYTICPPPTEQLQEEFLDSWSIDDKINHSGNTLLVEDITMLEREYAFFKENEKEFTRTHKDEYVVIKDDNVLGFYDSEIKAIKETVKHEELGTFLVQKCSTDENIVEFFSNRVSFG